MPWGVTQQDDPKDQQQDVADTDRRSGSGSAASVVVKSARACQSPVPDCSLTTAAAIFCAMTPTESRDVSKPARSVSMPLYSAT